MRLDQSITLYTQSLWLIAMLVGTLFFECTLYTRSACIIVHGTWAKDATWYRPSGDFFEAINQSNNDYGIVDDIVPFTWSGKLGYPAQLQAAQELVEIVKQYNSVILVAHSHGSTVGMIAANILQEMISNGAICTKIDKFYSLGVPVQPSGLIPNMKVIQKFYNLFSFGDLVQTVNGVYERVFDDSERIFNISVEIDNKNPGHSDLHSLIIAKHLLCIDEYYAQCNIGNFNCFASAPSKISFWSNMAPKYELQYDQEQLIQLDKQAHALSVLAFFRAHDLSPGVCQYVDYKEL